MFLLYNLYCHEVILACYILPGSCDFLISLFIFNYLLYSGKDEPEAWAQHTVYISPTLGSSFHRPRAQWREPSMWYQVTCICSCRPLNTLQSKLCLPYINLSVYLSLFLTNHKLERRYCSCFHWIPNRGIQPMLCTWQTHGMYLLRDGERFRCLIHGEKIQAGVKPLKAFTHSREICTL